MTAFSDTATLNQAEAEWDARSAKYFGSETAAVNVNFGALSHPGKVRANNEDHYSVVRRFRSREVLLTNMPLDTYPPQVLTDLQATSRFRETQPLPRDQ